MAQCLKQLNRHALYLLKMVDPSEYKRCLREISAESQDRRKRGRRGDR